MANNILSVIWITDQHWSYYYLLIGFLLLIICFLLYRLRQLKKNIGKEQDYYHSLFDILDNLPFPIMVKDIQNSFRYYYWNKESELQSGIKREEAIGCTDYEIYGEERGRKYRMWMNHLCRQTRYTGQKKATAQWTEQYMIQLP